MGRSLMQRVAPLLVSTAISVAAAYALRRYLLRRQEEDEVGGPVGAPPPQVRPPLRRSRRLPSLFPSPDAACLHAAQLKFRGSLNTHERAVARDILAASDHFPTFDEIGGLDEAKAALRESLVLPLRHPELFSDSKLLAAPKGILLYGPPGTGKTMLVKATAREAGCAFINVKLSSIYMKYLGVSEKMVRAIFTLARKLPACVIFVDEIDCVFRDRDAGAAGNNQYAQSIMAEFMSLWDGLETEEGGSASRVCVVAATNRPFDLDKAILRRLPRAIHIPLPDVGTREAIFRAVLAGERVGEDVHIAGLAAGTEGYSGSDIKEMCKAAAMGPAREIAAAFARDGSAAVTSQTRAINMKDFGSARAAVLASGRAAENYRVAHFQ